MFELAPRLLAVLETGDPVVVATAVAMSGSAPSGVGTSMAVLPRGQVVGTISGGCVEGSLFVTAEQVLEDGVPVLERFGFDEDPDDPDAVWAPALRCGGRIEVLVRRIAPGDPVVDALRRAASGVPTSLALSLDPARSARSSPLRTAAGAGSSSNVPTPDRAASWSVPWSPPSRSRTPRRCSATR